MLIYCLETERHWAGWPPVASLLWSATVAGMHAFKSRVSDKKTGIVWKSLNLM